MQTRTPATQAPTQDTAQETITLDGAIRDHVRTCTLWYRWPPGARHFGVSHHILWHFLERGHLCRPLPGAVIRPLATVPAPSPRPEP